MTALENCPINHGLTGPLTIKANALAFLEQGESELDSISPENVTLPRLKLEVDSMTVILLDGIKHVLFGDDSREWLVKEVGKKEYPHNDALLEAVGERASAGLSHFVSAWLEENNASGSDLLERANHYRAAYFRRSPIAYREEKNYRSIHALISSGIDTLGGHGPRIIHAINSTARLEKIEEDRRIDLIKRSGHMAILLSKLSLEDMTKYVNLLNAHFEEVIYAMARIEHRADTVTARFHPNLFNAMRGLDQEEWDHFDHRAHTGCVGAVDLDGAGSPLALGWRWLVSAAEEAGYWTTEEAWA